MTANKMKKRGRRCKEEEKQAKVRALQKEWRGRERDEETWRLKT